MWIDAGTVGEYGRMVAVYFAPVRKWSEVL